MLSDFFSLLYPKLCAGCGKSLMKSEKAICMECIYDFAPVDISQIDNNPVAKVFWGRVDLRFALSRIEFNKAHRIQKVLHAIKYDGNIQAAQALGELLAQVFVKHDVHVDLILPLPLHPRKLKSRGYNQAEEIAKGLSKELKVPLDNDILIRTHDSDSQTNKNREERWHNVEEVFALKHPDRLIGQNVVVIDDVLTTGATLEACVSTLQKGPVASIGIATVATVI